MEKLKAIYIKWLFKSLAKKLKREFGCEDLIIDFKQGFFYLAAEKQNIGVYLLCATPNSLMKGTIIFDDYHIIKERTFTPEDIKNGVFLNWIRTSFLEMLIGD